MKPTTTVATSRLTQEPEPKRSRFGSIADAFRASVPQSVRDIAGASVRTALSGERFINNITPGDGGTAARRKLEETPYVGRIASEAFDVGLSPLSIGTAGFGAKAQAAVRGLGMPGKIAASMLSPVAGGNFTTRLLSETILGTGGSLAAQEAEKRDAPLPVQLAAGVFGGGAALGLAGMARGAAKTFTRTAAQDTAREWGMNIGKRTYVADLLDADAVKAEIKTAADPLERGILGNRLIDPSRTIDGDIGRNWNTFTRQVRRGDQLAEIATGAALDSHATGAGVAAGVRGQIFDIADDGNIRNILPKREGASSNWYDVFSKPSDYNLDDRSLAYVNDWHKAKDEMIELLLEKKIIKARSEVDEALYVPRIVKGVREAEIKGRTNHMVERVYEEAREGVAAGIKYENDPKAVLQTFLRAGYKSVAEKQLDDLMLSSGNLLTGKQVLARTDAKVIQRVEAAAKALKDARRLARDQRELVIDSRSAIDGALLKEQKALTRTQSALSRAQQAANDNAARYKRPAAAHLQTRVSALEKKTTAIQDRIAKYTDSRINAPKVRSANGPAINPASASAIDVARKEFESARAAYKRAMDRVQKSEVLPGHVFGNDYEGSVRVGRWKGKFLPEDADYLKLADQVNTLTGRALPTKIDPFSKSVKNFADVVRLTSATGDLSMPFIQGLPLFGQNPVLWAKMAANHYHSMIDPSFNGRFLKQRLSTLQEMAQHGIPIGDVETFAAEGMGGVVSKAFKSRAGKQSIGRLQAAYDSGLTSARTLLWESLKPVWDGSPDELARYVRNMTGGLDSAALGVTPTQRAFESAWLGFSPRLLRSTMALVGMAANPTTPAGRQAARSLLGLAAFAGTMLTTTNVGIGLARGESEDEIKQRITDSVNPLGGRRFMALNVNGQYIGAGGQTRAITQFVAKAMANPGAFATANAYENPLINFYLSRGAPAVGALGAAVEGATGERVNVLPFNQIDDLPDALQHMGTSFLPFVVQAQMEADSLSNIDRAQMAGLGFAGLNVNPESASDQINGKAKEVFGKETYGELTGLEQQQLERDNVDLFALREKQRTESGGREERQRRGNIAEIDERRLNTERSLVDALGRGAITPDQFRDEMKMSQRIAAESKRPFIKEYDQSTDENKIALENWFATYDQAKIPGTELVDWDVHERLEADFLASLTTEQRRYVNDRRETKHAEEASWFFDAEKIIQSSDYYKSVDDAFEAVSASLPSEIDSYSKLVLALNRSISEGDPDSARYLRRAKARVDGLSSRAKVRLRREDEELDNALRLTGRVTTDL